ncbi:MAG: galactokinase [Chitinophagales bacterium]|nr:galactokinase [Chitinophagales bacterium]MDW8272981.1 galactokinase [Chitinophagales bacterium]
MRKYFSPGRINLIGEHTDYNGGLVLPVAISLGITAWVEESLDDRFELSSASHSQTISFKNNANFAYEKEYGWLNYPLGVFEYLKNLGYRLKPVRIHFESTLPEASGLSSSACIEVLSMYILLYESGYDVSRRDIACWCKEVENKYIGVNCGIMDQFCIANAASGHAMLLNCATLDYENIPVDLGNLSLFILNTRKPRQLIHSRYNERRAECEKALETIKVNTQNNKLKFLCEVSINELESIEDHLLHKRAKHVISENDRVKTAAYALKSKDLISFASLLNQSHQSLSYDYEVSGKELDTIVSLALKHPACVAARMTGAGFGGCAIALADTQQAESFKLFVENYYRQTTGLPGEVYFCTISQGVYQIN